MPRQNSTIQQIAMLSTHGYFDPVPHLGRTDTGGQVVYVLELAKALSTLQVHVDIFTRWFDHRKEQIDPVPDNPRVRIIRIPAGSWNFIPKEDIYDILPELTDNMIEFIKGKNLNYDLFHGHYVDGGVVTVDVARLLNKPSFFTPHSLGAWKRDRMKGDPREMEKKFKFKHRISEELRVFQAVNGLAATSMIQEEKLDQLYGFQSNNIANLPPGTNIHIYRPLRPDEEDAITDSPDKYIFCLSRIDSNKGHDLLLNAFDLVRKEINDIHLIIGGGSTKPQNRELDVLEKIKQTIINKKLQHRVSLIGYVPDELMAPYYRKAKLFVLPSIFEPFGMTAAEAMACGTPVVASKFAGIKNAITSGENGLLVDPANTTKFADAMIKLLQDEKQAQRLGQNGCETIRKEYSWEAIARRHMAFYQKFMGI
jgi:mannosylfructose-phosphate synthase